MPLKKYKSAFDLPAPPELPPLAPQNLRVAFAWMEFAVKFSPEPLKPGLKKIKATAT